MSYSFWGQRQRAAKATEHSADRAPSPCDARKTALDEAYKAITSMPWEEAEVRDGIYGIGRHRGGKIMRARCLDAIRKLMLAQTP